MKITILTTVFDGANKTQKTENVQKNDLRIEMLANVKSLFTTWNILDSYFDYECGQTKYGYRVIKTVVQHKTTRHTTIQQIIYN